MKAEEKKKVEELLFLEKDQELIKKKRILEILVKKSRLELSWVSGNEVQTLVESVLSTPKSIIAATRQNLYPRGKLQQAKLTYIDAKGKISKIQRGGRRIILLVDGKKVKVGISGSGTKIMVDGKKAKRKAFNAGMVCTVSYLGEGTTARSALELATS